MYCGAAPHRYYVGIPHPRWQQRQQCILVGTSVASVVFLDFRFDSQAQEQEREQHWWGQVRVIRRCAAQEGGHGSHAGDYHVGYRHTRGALEWQKIRERETAAVT